MNSAKWRKVKEHYWILADMPLAERDKHLSLLDSDMALLVSNMLLADDQEAKFLDQAFVIESGLDHDKMEISEPETIISGYKIIRKIGSGGMGSIYLADRTQDEFSQLSAIKLIKSGMDSEAVVKRFISERQILAELDHQNIARLIDGGTTADGRPFFVMEYVDGVEIRDYCAINELSLRERLRLFLKVCSAVASAHQKLVVHRDIKPTNILVTKEGDPKLLDFGIAKIIEPDSFFGREETATQFRLLTPEYASPEQIKGKLTNTSTDVYSLGVVLFELISGKRPYNAEEVTRNSFSDDQIEPHFPSAVANFSFKSDDKATNNREIQQTDDRAVKTSRGLPASELREVKGDLDNIILKAIKLDADRRYRSVQEFADDIHRYLDGMPVKATADSRFYRFGKFVKRHRIGVVGTAVAATLLIAATGITGWQYSIATAERQNADKRFQEVRKLANTILFDHYERIKELPGATEARAKLASDALEYLDRLSADSGNDPDVLKEVAEAYKKLAEVQNENNAGGNLGDEAASNANHLRALDILERIDRLGLQDPKDKRALAKSYINVSYFYESEPDKRSEYLQKGLNILREMLVHNPDKTQARGDYASALWEWANYIRISEGNKPAIAIYEQSVAIREELIREDQNNQTQIGNASLTYKNLGTLFSLEKDFAKCLEFYQKALEMDERQLAATPDNVRVKMAVSFSLKGISKAHLDIGNIDKAIEEDLRAIELQEIVSSQDPKNSFAAKSLVRSYGDIAIAYKKAGRVQEAAKYFTKAVELDEKQIGDDSQILNQRALLFYDHGKFLLETGDRDIEKNRAAHSQLRKSEAMFSDLKKANTFEPAYQDKYEDLLSILK